jgi:hypothetical protein
MRPRPVLILTALMAAFSALAGAGTALDFLPRPVVATILLVGIVVAAAGGALVQGAVTPLADPQDSAGRPLVPLDAIEAQKTAARVGATVALQQAASGDTLRG